MLSYECKDWGILRLRDSSVGSGGVCCVVAECGLPSSVLSCGDVNVMVVSRWTRQPFYRCTSSCPPVLNTLEWSLLPGGSEAELAVSSAWPSWERPDSLRREDEDYLEISEYQVIGRTSESPRLASLRQGSSLLQAGAPNGTALSFVGKVAAISPIIPSNEKHALVEIEVVVSGQETACIHVAFLVLRDGLRYVR